MDTRKHRAEPRYAGGLFLRLRLRRGYRAIRQRAGRVHTLVEAAAQVAQGRLAAAALFEGLGKGRGRGETG